MGNGTNGFSDVPVAVSGLSGATAVSSGFYYMCGLVARGAAKCWGLGQSGQLGNGSSANAAVPVSVSGSHGFTALSAGNDDTCVIVPPSGGLTCWGAGDNGGLGNGASMSGTATPVAVPGLTGVSQVAMGGFFGCALVGGTVSCWGDGALGQLGDGSTPVAQETPVAVWGFRRRRRSRSAKTTPVRSLARQPPSSAGAITRTASSAMARRRNRTFQ